MRMCLRNRVHVLHRYCLYVITVYVIASAGQTDSWGMWRLHKNAALCVWCISPFVLPACGETSCKQL